MSSAAGTFQLPQEAANAGLGGARWTCYAMRDQLRNIDKFWRVRHRGRFLETWWGRAGSNGSHKVKAYATDSASSAARVELTRQKAAKGYVRDQSAELTVNTAPSQRRPEPRRPDQGGRIPVFAQQDVFGPDRRLTHVRGSVQMLMPAVAAEVVEGSRGAYGYVHPDDAELPSADTLRRDAGGTVGTPQLTGTLSGVRPGAGDPGPRPTAITPRGTLMDVARSMGIIDDLGLLRMDPMARAIERTPIREQRVIRMRVRIFGEDFDGTPEEVRQRLAFLLGDSRITSGQYNEAMSLLQRVEREATGSHVGVVAPEPAPPLHPNVRSAEARPLLRIEGMAQPISATFSFDPMRPPQRGEPGHHEVEPHMRHAETARKRHPALDNAPWHRYVHVEAGVRTEWRVRISGKFLETWVNAGAGESVQAWEFKPSDTRHVSGEQHASIAMHAMIEAKLGRGFVPAAVDEAGDAAVQRYRATREAIKPRPEATVPFGMFDGLDEGEEI